MSDTEILKTTNGTLQGAPEPTHSGPVYNPAVDIFESEDKITVLADLPGVAPENLTIDLRDDVLTLVGRVPDSSPPRENLVLREHCAGTFLRQFTLSESIDQSKIDAKLSDGVLRLELPKQEKAKPRRITVQAN